MAGEHFAQRFRAEVLGTAVVMLAPVIGWWTAYSVATGPGAGRVLLTAVVTITVLAIGTTAFRARRAQWNPLLLAADALLERRRGLTGGQCAGHLLTQLAAAMVVAGGVVAVSVLAGIPAPAAPAPNGVHAVFEMTAAAAAVISFFAAARTPALRMSAAGASALVAAVFVVSGAGFLGNPAVVAGAVVLGLNPVTALVITICQLAGCLIGYRVATAWWPDTARRLDALTT